MQTTFHVSCNIRKFNLGHMLIKELDIWRNLMRHSELQVLLSHNRYKDSGESIKSFPPANQRRPVSAFQMDIATFLLKLYRINFLVIKGAKWRDLISRINNAAAGAAWKC